MCGIAGIIRLDGSAPERDRLVAMSDQLLHRGPDGSGVWIDRSVGFSHRRLSIIDVAGSPQPMTSADGRLTVVFNGEIFNYRELRRSVDYPWRTDGDTEVLLALHSQFGDDAVSRLKGQFAYAIHDRDTSTVTLYRDRLGVLPLYTYSSSREVIFASEVKAILAVAPSARQVAADQLDAYLAGRSVPAPRTLFAGVNKLPPGHFQRIAADGAGAPQQYWRPPSSAETMAIDGASATSKVRKALTAAVDRALVADVPVGAYLSGGVDSSLIVALARRERGDIDLHTFSAGFGDARTDELHHAQAVSLAIGTVHHPVIVTAADFSESWQSLTWNRDAPMSEPADVAVARLAAAASEHVKVVLSGEGSDELFAGYPKYRAARATGAFAAIPARLRTPTLNAIATRLPPGGRRARTMLRAAAAASDTERLRAWFAPFAVEAREQLTGHASEPPQPYASRPIEGDAVRRMSLFDMGAWLSDNLLERGDRMSMSASVELRPPFLDAEVVDLAMRLPSAVKLHRGTTKWVVKEVARELLPASIVDRAKSGFKVPLDTWFRGGLRDMANDMLQSPTSFVGEVFDRGAVRSLLQDHSSGHRDEAIGIWTLLSLEVWHDVFFGAGHR